MFKETANGGAASAGFVALAQATGDLSWVVVIGTACFLYFGALYGAPSRTAPRRNEEHTSPPRRPRVARNLVLGVIAFLLVDAAIFHSRLYPSILAPQSFAGRVTLLVDRERQRPLSPARRVLVVGDSRVAEGFWEQHADEVAGPGWNFINAAVAGSTPRVWSYMLREMDPAADRYDAIVVPIAYRDIEIVVAAGRNPPDYVDRALDIKLIAPLLRYTDAISFAPSFPSWSNQCRAAAACILRGSAYQSDVVDLIEHPLRRFHQLREKGGHDFSPSSYRGRSEDVTAAHYDQETETITVSDGFPEEVEAMLKRALKPPPAKQTGRWIVYREKWIGGILRRYARSHTRIVLVQLPRGPFVRRAMSPAEEESTVSTLVTSAKTILLDQDRFRHLEKPEFFFDAYHPNARGRIEITEGLVNEVVKHLGAGPVNGSSSKAGEGDAL